jgi:hypothetical protein
MSDNIYNRLIDFRAGSQEEYDSLLNEVGGVSEEDLYYISRDLDYSDTTTTINNLYIGTNLIGDAYNSQYIDNPSKRVTNPIGLIPYGMTLGRLLTDTGGSLSKVVDMMLFTNRAPSIDECGIIAGFIPKIDVDGKWENWSRIQNWIKMYAEPFFDENKYEMFYDLQGQISTLFTVMLDPSKSAEEYNGMDTGIYTGRMFVAIPHRDGEGKDITTIVDKVFQQVYRGSGLIRNFLTYDSAVLDFGDKSYRYKIYLFGVDQNVISRANMEYCVSLE